MSHDRNCSDCGADPGLTHATTCPEYAYQVLERRRRRQEAVAFPVTEAEADRWAEDVNKWIETGFPQFGGQILIYRLARLLISGRTK